MSGLRVERSGAIFTLTLDRPGKKNAIDAATFDELLARLRELKRGDEARCVVLTGAGDDFCSGFDLSGGGHGRHQMAFMRTVGDVVLALHDLPVPTIAKIRGVAAGVGANLALACDLTVAGDTARFSEIFARRGLSVDGGGSWLLPRLIGLHRAKELVYFAELLGAEELAALGLVNRVVPDAELDAFVEAWAQRLATGPTVAHALNKKLLHHGLQVSLAEAVEAEATANGVSTATEDVAEGIGSMLERRPPVFRGR